MVGVKEILERIKPSELKLYCQKLSERYRKQSPPYLVNREDRLAYLALRYPATYAAIEKVLTEIASYPVRSFLDLGAGPGTGWHVVKSVFPHVEVAELYEQDAIFVSLGQEASEGDPVTWICQDVRGKSFSAKDLVLLSYSIGEIPEKEWENLLSAAWDAATLALVIIEPGTPVGFERIRKIRERLIEKGAFIAAPCPHEGTCPMSQGDWCHFSVRLPRDSLQKYVKEASLGHEDEKFSYIIAAKHPVERGAPRILRHPQTGSGHITFKLCTLDGLKNKVVSKKEGPLYRTAKKLAWGDLFYKY